MAIRYTKYVSILSEKIGSTSSTTRLLIPRVFTTNPLVPTETSLTFTDPDDVKDYFGESSEEYLRASFALNWVSKSLLQLPKISFYFWPLSDTAPLIYGATGTYAYTDFTGITAGTFDLTIGGITETVSIDWSTATDLATVASLLQTAIQTAGASDGTVWTGATVTYNATRGSFDFEGGAAGAAALSLEDGTDTPLSLLGWSATDTIVSDGVAAQTVSEMLDTTVQASNNFGSIFFTDDCGLTLSQLESAADWNADQGVDYMLPAGVTAADAATWSAALFTTAGVGLTLIDRTTYPGEYDEMIPGIILGATSYSAKNGVQGYMYQQFDDLTPKVTTTTLSNSYDNLRVNYVGGIQPASTEIGFYQRGVLMGGTKVPVNMNIYANEQWFKDTVTSALLDMLLAYPEVPTNTRGKTIVRATLQTCIKAALKCGAFQAGKTLSDTQKAAIKSLTDDDTAYTQVATNGYYLTISFESYTTDDDRTEWKAVYTIVYSKDDTIRKVTGTHALV